MRRIATIRATKPEQAKNRGAGEVVTGWAEDVRLRLRRGNLVLFRSEDAVFDVLNSSLAS